MTLARISISQSLGWLAAHTDPGDFKVSEETPVMKMRNELPAVELHIEHPRVLIDQKDAFYTSGLKTCHRQAMDYFKECEQKGKSVAGVIAEEGKEFVRIERHNKPIQAQARRLWEKDPRLTVTSMAKVPPRVETKLGTVEVKLREGDPNTQIDFAKRPGVYRAAEVRGSWLQAPYLVIDTVPSRISGAIVDTIV